MSLNANELLDLMEEILDGDEYIEEEDSEEEDDEYDDEEEDDEYDDDDDDDEDVEERFVAASKKIKNGHLVTTKAHNVGPLSADQKRAIKIMQRKSHTGRANKNRRKSMNVRRRKGL